MIRLLRIGSTTSSSYDAQTGVDRLLNKGNGVLLDREFADQPNASRYAYNILAKDKSQAFFVVNENNLILETVMDTDEQEQIAKRSDKRWTVICFFGFAAVSWLAFTFKGVSTDLALIAEGSLLVYFLLLVLILGPRRCLKITAGTFALFLVVLAMV